MLAAEVDDHKLLYDTIIHREWAISAIMFKFRGKRSIKESYTVKYATPNDLTFICYRSKILIYEGIQSQISEIIHHVSYIPSICY